VVEGWISRFGTYLAAFTVLRTFVFHVMWQWQARWRSRSGLTVVKLCCEAPGHGNPLACPSIGIQQGFDDNHDGGKVCGEVVRMGRMM